ncbi:MAG: cobyrinate a,c-diamide synthase [Deltaproteobacteria bacterium]|nr:cobyrinate a,c-diamide synthase [Deltaproteobacteria bacterium]MBW2303828.1 cobyrinate a,c-diamide synthase [Deltaproteobacteria bacterium]
MGIPAFVIAGTHSGCGKTTAALGIMAALKARGLRVQAFKVGPDFIDPGHHRRITGRASHNLDGWMMGADYNRGIFGRYGRDADVVVVEGVMGLFDGFSGRDDAGSTAQMAKWLNLPVILVIDAGAMARSAGAVALGFSRFDPALSIRGFIFNRVGSQGHGRMLEDAVRSITAPPVLGCLPTCRGLEIPSRHLGLVTDEDFRMDEDAARRLADWIEENLDLDGLLGSLEPVEMALSETIMGGDGPERAESRIRIAVALDEAFCFYYPENLRLLEEAGAELVPFSPLRSEHLPEDLDGLILGGGYPELHCEALCSNRTLMNEIRDFALDGGPVYAECGGFMYLMREIRDLEGRSFPMAGVFPVSACMERRLSALGYREIITGKESLLGPPGTRARGHEFHYSRIVGEDGLPERIYSVRGRKSFLKAQEGYSIRRVLGSYIHLHWGSNPEVAGHIVDYCRTYRGGHGERKNTDGSRRNREEIL